MTRPWIALTVDEVEAVPWRGSELVWHPLRQALDLHAFGAGAYTATRIGQEIVEPHAELPDGRGHEELYVVLAGRVTFRFGGEEVDAAAGTCVAVRPETHRAAYAADVPATVLAFGGPPTFQVAGGEWVDRARPYLRSDPGRARRVLDEGRAEVGESPGLLMGIAALAAVEGRTEEGRDALQRAIAGNPAVREAAEADPDLAPLLGGP
jgi:mannose-6-phosphate isomerase-like protein (cupin superfamily)